MGIVAISKQSDILMREEYTCYEEHEVATHGYTHPFFSQLPPEMVTYKITRDRAETEQFFGKIIRGHAYNQLQFSKDGTIVHNPTSTDLWIGQFHSDEVIKVPAGKTVKI